MRADQSLAAKPFDRRPDVFANDLGPFHREGDPTYRALLRAEAAKPGNARPLTSALDHTLFELRRGQGYGSNYTARNVFWTEAEALFGRAPPHDLIAISALFLPRGGLIWLSALPTLTSGKPIFGQFIVSARQDWAGRMLQPRRPDPGPVFHALLGMWATGFETPNIKASGLLTLGANGVGPLE